MTLTHTPDARLASTEWDLWSTHCRLVVTEPRLLPLARHLADQELRHVERAVSRFRPDSELMLLRPGTNHIGPVFVDLLALALDAAELTAGAVDPTVGGAMVALGYDRDIHEVQRRGPLRITTQPAPGWRSLDLHLSTGRLDLPAGVHLDLGATAKAAAADRCARLVHDRLGCGVLVSLGGDIATAGDAPEGHWQVLVQDLASDVPQQVSLYAGAAIATSSTAKRRWSGGEVHHLVDPSTGAPARSPWRAAKVVAPSAFVANAHTTAALVKGDDALGWLIRSGLPARLLAHDGSVLALNGFPEEVTR